MRKQLHLILQHFEKQRHNERQFWSNTTWKWGRKFIIKAEYLDWERRLLGYIYLYKEWEKHFVGLSFLCREKKLALFFFFFTWPALCNSLEELPVLAKISLMIKLFIDRLLGAHPNRFLKVLNQIKTVILTWRCLQIVYNSLTLSNSSHPMPAPRN